MDAELYDEAALQNTFAAFFAAQASHQKHPQSHEDNEEDDDSDQEYDDDGDDDDEEGVLDRHFLENLLAAQAEGLGAGSSAFSQLLGQLGLQLPRPPPATERKKT